MKLVVTPAWTGVYRQAMDEGLSRRSSMPVQW